jgi:AcrR family transcriptional regulator
MRTGRRRGPAPAPRQRLSPEERRRHLLQVAAGLISARGVDAVQFPEVAAAAGITRQLVYRFFPSRQALIMAVLEDFAEALTQRLGRAAVYNMPGNLEEGTRLFVEAVCDTIEAKGAGPWHLLDSKGPDREVARLGQEIQSRLVGPQLARIADAIGVSEREAAVVAQMIVAGGRAALEQWYNGTISCEEAVRATTLGVTALLKAFARDDNLRAKKARAK